MEFLLFVGLVFLAIAHVRLGGRVRRIEGIFDAVNAAHASPATQTPAASPAPLPSDGGALSDATPPAPTPGSGFFLWLQEDWLVKVGALLLFIGCSWFVSYAFANNWVGPMGRITIGLLAGSAFMVFGWMRMGRLVRQGSIFLALGTSVVVLTTYAARSAYDFFTPASALAIMFFAVLFAAVASLRMRTEWLAWMSVTSAYAIPLLTASHEVHELQLFTYLFLVTLGVMWLVFLTDWRRIFVTSLAAIFLYSLPFWMSGFVTEGGLLIYGYLFVALFFVANLAGFLSLSEGRGAEVEIVGAIANAIILSGWTHVGIGEELQSMVYAAWAIVFLIGAYVFAVRMYRPIAFFLYGGIGVILIGVATALELEGPALTIAFLLESTVAILLAQIAAKNTSFHWAAYLTFVVPLLLALESVGDFPSYPSALWNEHVAVTLLTTLALLLIGWRAREITRLTALTPDTSVTFGGFFLSLFGFSTFVFLWNFFHLLLPTVVATQVSLFVSIVVGVALYVTYQAASTSGGRALRFAGLLLVLFVVGHLLLIEVWGMGIVPRIITFFVIGLFLMATAFIKKLRV